MDAYAQNGIRHIRGLKRGALDAEARRAGIKNPQHYNAPELHDALITRIYGNATAAKARRG